MAPESILHHISFPSTSYSYRRLFCNLYLPIYTKNIYLIIFIRSHFCKWPWRDWQPLYRVGCKVLTCLCRRVGLERGLLLDWHLGSQKLREILTLLCCITLSSSRENQRSAQQVERRISGAVDGEIYAQVKTYQVPITNSYPSHYIICHLPLVFLSPTSPLPFHSPSLSILPIYLPPFARFLFARVVGIVVYLLLNREPKIYGSSSTC